MRLKAKAVIARHVTTKLKGWSISDESYVTKGVDPTEVEVYKLTQNHTKILLQQFFGDWNIEVNGTELTRNTSLLKANELMLAQGAPSINQIRRAIDAASTEFFNYYR